MNISLNWLKAYLDLDHTPDKVAEILTDIGLEVEGQHEIESIRGGLRGVVVGLVKECDRHPNADRLSLTKVDIGNGGLLQIICGAPNVAQGQKVLVATVGTTLYDSQGNDFQIKKGKIRGEVSEGMICAEDELGLGEDHSGIIVLPETVAIGTPASEYYRVERDVIFEIGLTPNRSDATSHIGVARDLAAALQINYGHSGKLNLPSVQAFSIDNEDLPVAVSIENEEACPRYVGVSIKNVTIGESPEWLRKRLQSIGVRPLNNIIDITNFILHELGQPLHAFDLDRIAGQKVIVKTLKPGSKFVTLDEVVRELSEEDLMICDGESRGMCIAGIFGGIGSGVTALTRNIFLESAHFHPKWIRRSSTRHQLRTDAARVFEKGSDPNLALFALKRAALMIKELAGGQIASQVIDIYPKPIRPVEIPVKYQRVHRLIGVAVPREEIKAILNALNIEVVKEEKDEIRVAVPTSKADVLREVDVIEEILRIYGLNKVPLPAQIRTPVTPGDQKNPFHFKNVIADLLTANGFYEMMALSLVSSRHFEPLNSVDDQDLVYINNTSNRELDVMRPNLLFGGLEAILYNQNRQNSDLRLYEFGNSYIRSGEDLIERQHLVLFLTGIRHPESWIYTDKKEVDYYTLKTFVRMIMNRVGIANYQHSQLEEELFSHGSEYHQGRRSIVKFGAVSNTILEKMSIKAPVYYADVDWENLLKASGKERIEFTELGKYPAVRRDLALVIENSVNFHDIVDIAKKTGKELLKDINLFDIYKNEKQFGKDKKSYAVSFVFADPEKTLRDKDVEKIMKKMIHLFEQKLGAAIR